jgi:hypothetical protein
VGPVVLFVLHLLAAPQQPSEEPASIVAGRVIDAATGRPIAGAVITSAGSAVAPPGASGPVRVMTNTGGNFVLRGVSKGTLVLTATKGSYVNAQPGQRRPGGSAQPIRVGSAQRITDVEIRMWKFSSISGMVIDEGGDPAVNTRVQALRRTFTAGRVRFEEGPVVVTDDRGVYRIAGLTPADYVVAIPSTQTSVPAELMDVFFGGTPLPRPKRLEVSREMNAIGSAIAPAGSQYAMRAGGQTFSLPGGSVTPAITAAGTIVYPTIYYPAAPSIAQASVVTLRSGEERAGVDMQVRPARGVRVSGMLLGPDGGVSITAVRLLPARDDDAAVPFDVATTMTDWTGAFTFAAVPPGQYVLHVLKPPRPTFDDEDLSHVSVTPGGITTISSTPPTGPPPGPPPIPADATLFARIPLSVGDTGVEDFIAPLSPAPRVSGRVEFLGAVEKPSSEQVAAMRITLEPVDGARFVEPSLALTTGRPDGSGEFRTFGVPPGRYVLRTGPNIAGWYLQSATYQGRDIADIPLNLESKDAAGVVITFTDRPSSIAGKVTGAQGADATAVVIAYPIDEAMWADAPRRMRTARAAADGAYSIQALPPGEYYVAAVQEDLVGEWQDPALLRALAKLAQRVRIVEGEQKSVNLRAGAIR